MVKSDQTSSVNKSDDIQAVTISIVVKDKMVPLFFFFFFHGLSINV